MKIKNLQFFDPNGKPADAYIVRTYFYTPYAEEYADGLYCCQNKEQAFQQMFDDWKKHRPSEKITRWELLRIENSWA